MEIKLTNNLSLFPRKQALVINGKTTRLTTLENDLLVYLSNNRNELSVREYVLTEVWGENNYFNARSMDVYICKLRKILKPISGIELLSVHGKGHRLLIESEPKIDSNENSNQSGELSTECLE